MAHTGLVCNSCRTLPHQVDLESGLQWSDHGEKKDLQWSERRRCSEPCTMETGDSRVIQSGKLTCVSKCKDFLLNWITSDGFTTDKELGGYFFLWRGRNSSESFYFHTSNSQGEQGQQFCGTISYGYPAWLSGQYDPKSLCRGVKRWWRRHWGAAIALWRHKAPERLNSI